MSRRVVVIDDEDDVREITELSLQHFGGWSVTAVDNGEDGAAVAAREVPDVVLLDVMMPGLDGEGTARLLRTNAATADVPVVLLTASTHRPAWADELGVVGVIAKPFDPTTLAAELDRLLGG